MFVYRLSSPEYIDDLSGTGSRQCGGRWNEKGTPMVYFAASRAMAIMELLVRARPDQIVRDFSLAVFELPDLGILTINIADLPANWKSLEYGDGLKKLGEKFIKDQKYLIKKAPSVILEEEYNILLNPMHPAAKNIRMLEKRPFKFDRRFKQ